MSDTVINVIMEDPNFIFIVQLPKELHLAFEISCIWDFWFFSSVLLISNFFLL